MDILQVTGSLVCTCRVDALKHVSLRVLKDKAGTFVVATDFVGAKPGNWVFVTTGTAARFASGDFEITTDLAICGIIDFWPEND
tara:strand:+ start:11542 stop:11793 length:252 start_codon:yes stop_codon:yes gene_type:complete